MSDYIVSARKYRPMTFDTVVGQHGLTTTLRNAIATGKLAHAYLFCGPRGVGKTTSARIFAKNINCLSPNANGDACGTCESCCAFDERRSFNIHELDAASNNSVEDIRQLIDEVRIPPQVGKYKVFIIDEVHMLSQAAFNAFLKTLEEPPAHVIFILATTEKHKILPTILSRCQVYDFSRITTADIVAHLREVAQREGYTTDDEALAVIAEKADGGMRDALSIFDQVAAFTQGDITYDKVIAHLGALDTSYYFRLVDMLLNKEIAQSMVLLDEILRKGFDGGLFVGGLATHLRNVMMSRDAVTLPLLECTESMRDKYAAQAARCSDSFIYRALKRCNACEINYRQSRNKRLLVEITLIQVAQADDEPGAGRRPADILNPIFEQEQGSEPNPASKSSKTIPQQTVTVVPPSKASSATAKLPKASLGTSISRIVHDQKAEESTEDVQPKHEAVSETPVLQPDTPTLSWDDGNLTKAWLSYANQIASENPSMSQRMLDMAPACLKTGVFSVTISNQQLVGDWKQIAAGLQTYMAGCFGLRSCTMEILVDEQEQHVAMNRIDQFADMAQRNPALERLKQQFQLDFA